MISSFSCPFFNSCHLHFTCSTLFLTSSSFSNPQCVLFSANIGPAPKMTSAATASAWAAAWSPTQPVTVWPAAASSTKVPACSAAQKTTSPTRAGAVSHSNSVRICTTHASGRRSAARARTAANTSSTTAPASPSVPLATRPSTPPRKCTRRQAERLLMAHRRATGSMRLQT